MLQLTKFYEDCFRDFRDANRDNFNAKLSREEFIDLSINLFEEIDRKRILKSRMNPLYYLDHKTWTNKVEHLDDPKFDVRLKSKIVEALHLKNKFFGTYSRVIELLRPLIEEINRTENRPARILELGSGSGKLSMAIYERLKKTNLQVDLTGSDIVAEYIQSANQEAKNKNYKIKYKIIDAFLLEELPPNSYDIIFTLHSMHHFRPDQLITTMSGAHHAASRAFIGIDGYRGLSNLLFIALTAGGKSLLSLNRIFFHDAFISGRRMYSAKQLEIMARLGCPNAHIETKNLIPGLTIVSISRPKKVPLDFL